MNTYLRLLVFISLSYQVVCFIQEDETCSDAAKIGLNVDGDYVADKYNCNGDRRDYFDTETENEDPGRYKPVDDVAETEVPNALAKNKQDEDQPVDHIQEQELTSNTQIVKEYRLPNGQISLVKPDEKHTGTNTLEHRLEKSAGNIADTEVPGDSVEILHDDKQSKESNREDAPMTSEDQITDDDTTENMFPELPRIDPGNVGDEVEVELEPGQFYTRITKAVQPPIFVVPNFLTEEECDHIIVQAAKKGLMTSNLFRANVVDEYKTKKSRDDISRISEQTWLYKNHLRNYTKLQNRISKLTKIPKFILQRSEALTVVSYKPGGHYHAHYDTSRNDSGLPCCGQIDCDNETKPWTMDRCCRLCRYITVMFYLNEPELGGETAFPLADMSDKVITEKERGGNNWLNLSRFCHNASLTIPPRRGMAVMWYNHDIDNKTNYLGPIDGRSIHGGCNIIKGTKWIATYWIVGTTYEDRLIPSVWFDDTDKE